MGFHVINLEAESATRVQPQSRNEDGRLSSSCDGDPMPLKIRGARRRSIWSRDLKIPRYDDRYSSNDRYGDARLYVGHLFSLTRERDLEHLFSKYGRTCICVFTY
ncbi:hypothetical protein Bca101_081116 [Brassica carinata]